MQSCCTICVSPPQGWGYQFVARRGGGGILGQTEGAMDVTVFHKLLTSAIQKGASDIHIQVGYPPLMRVNGELLEVKYHPLTPRGDHGGRREILSNTYRREKLADLSEWTSPTAWRARAGSG